MDKREGSVSRLGKTLKQHAQGGSPDNSRVGSHSEDSVLKITWRGVAIGAATIVAWFYYIIVFMGVNLTSSTFVLSQYPMVAVIPFVLWLFLNVLLKTVWPSIALTRGELLTVFSMTWIVGALPMWGWSDYWVAVMGAPYFMATTENQWDTLILPYMPWHAFPEPSERVIHTFWLGLPEGMPLPWDAWVGVIARWVSASVAMVVFGLCLVILFRRQWVEAEKLAFPLAQFPLELTRGLDGPRRLPDLFHSPLFWMGFGVVFVPLLYNIATYFSPGLPIAGFYLEHYRVTLPRPFPGVTLRVLPLVLALVYLCPLDIMGSLILFYFIAVFKTGMMDQIGFSVGSAGQQLSSGDILDLESYGAMVYIALWSLWLARRHLREVWQAVTAGTGDSSDVRLYRITTAGMLVSGFYVIGFGISLGASLPVAVATFTLMTVSFFVTVKLIAATGFPYLMPTWANAKGGLLISDLIGSANLPTQSVVAFKLFISQAFFGNIRLPAWPALPHHLRIFSLRAQPGRVCAVVLIAFPVGCLVAALSSIVNAYDQGGYVHLPHAFNVYPQIATLLNHPRLFDFGKWIVWLTGFLETAGLAYLRGRFHWFPLHPIGLAFQYSPGLSGYWFTLLIVWITKFSLLRYGGSGAYQAGKPFFYGLGVGYVIGVVLSGFVDVIWFPGDEHRVHYW